MARSQQLRLAVPENLPRAHADPARLTEMLISLLSNGHEYTPEGDRIGVRAPQQDVYVRSATSVTGTGLSPENQAQLFTKGLTFQGPPECRKYQEPAWGCAS